LTFLGENAIITTILILIYGEYIIMSYLNYSIDNPQEFTLIPYKLTDEMLRQLDLARKERISKKDLDNKDTYHSVKRVKAVATSIIGIYGVYNYFITEKMVKLADKLFSITNFSSLKPEEAVGALGFSALMMCYVCIILELANINRDSREKERLNRLHNEAYKIIKELHGQWIDKGEISENDGIPWCLRTEKKENN
jgi:hypothetical protein